jgi:hypothetical protein
MLNYADYTEALVIDQLILSSERWKLPTLKGWNQASDKSYTTLQQVVILVRGMQLVRGTFPSRVAMAVASIISSKQMSWHCQIKTGTRFM